KNSKDSFAWLFFDLFEYEEDDERVTKVQCSIEGCEVEYTWHSSTSNMINHLRDVHHITKMSLENKTIETILTKPHSKQIQQKLTCNIVKLFLSCTLPLSLIENENFHTFLNSFDPQYKAPCKNTLKHKISDATIHTTKTINYMISTQADIMYDSTLSVIEIDEYKTTSNIVSTIEPVLEEFGISRSKL
ncbi:20651_t:CDS:2, partial [Cetraspora pellucida]